MLVDHVFFGHLRFEQIVSPNLIGKHDGYKDDFPHPAGDHPGLEGEGRLVGVPDPVRHI